MPKLEFQDLLQIKLDQGETFIELDPPTLHPKRKEGLKIYLKPISYDGLSDPLNQQSSIGYKYITDTGTEVGNHIKTHDNIAHMEFQDLYTLFMEIFTQYSDDLYFDEDYVRFALLDEYKNIAVTFNRLEMPPIDFSRLPQAMDELADRYSQTLLDSIRRGQDEYIFMNNRSLPREQRDPYLESPPDIRHFRGSNWELAEVTQPLREGEDHQMDALRYGRIMPDSLPVYSGAMQYGTDYEIDPITGDIILSDGTTVGNTFTGEGGTESNE